MASASSSPLAATASSAAVRRLRKDFETLERSQNPQLTVRPSEASLLEWHFVLHSLPSDSPYAGGCYHGKILFPPEYPHAPPGILMVTPSGRLETGRRLCLSMTDFHPESWNPAWSVETILVGLLSFFVSDTEHGFGALSSSVEERQRLATESWTTNAASPEFVALFPEYSGLPQSPSLEDVPAILLTADALPTDTSSTSEAVAEAPEVPARQVSNDEAPMECWICRDNTAGEPMIQPCTCRGSMSGVHASCVEEWIRHHRRNAVNDAAPQCSVCHQAYQGYERRPGLSHFLRQKCREVSLQLLRTFALVFVLLAYQVAASPEGLPDPHLVIWVRVLVIVIFSALAAHKLMVLTVSLPPHQLPPQNRFLQRFFEADFRVLAMHIAEATSGICVLIMWYVLGMVTLVSLLPFLIASAIPFGKLFWRSPSLACLRRVCLGVGFFVTLPIILLGSAILLIRRHPRRVFHPLGPGLHMALAIAVVPMALNCQSNLPLLVLWGTHSLFLSAGIIATFACRLQWQDGTLWLIAVQLTLLAAYVANVCVFPKGLGTAEESGIIVACCSSAWLLLVCGLALGINWDSCVQYYRTWQHQHGSFTLQQDHNCLFDPAHAATQRAGRDAESPMLAV